MLIARSAPHPAIKKTPRGGMKIVKMMRRICEIMLAVVLVELWASAMRGWMDLDVNDGRD